MPVPVAVTHSHPHPIAGVRSGARAVGRVHELPAALVAIEAVHVPVVRHPGDGELPALDEVEVEVTVGVEVRERRARAHGLREMLLGGEPRVVGEVEPPLLSHVGEGEGARGLGRCLLPTTQETEERDPARVSHHLPSLARSMRSRIALSPGRMARARSRRMMAVATSPPRS